MLITGIQSVFEPRGELVVANCEVLTHFGRYYAFLVQISAIRNAVRIGGRKKRNPGETRGIWIYLSVFHGISESHAKWGPRLG